LFLQKRHRKIFLFLIFVSIKQDLQYLEPQSAQIFSRSQKKINVDLQKLHAFFLEFSGSSLTSDLRSKLESNELTRDFSARRMTKFRLFEKHIFFLDFTKSNPT
jgi:hypothetical protein